MNFFIHNITGIETAVHVCNYLIDNAHHTVQEQLEKTDVTNKLQYTQSVLYRLQHHIHSQQLSDPCHPVVIAITGVVDIVKLLRIDLVNIRTIGEKHKQQWFNTWYSPNDKHALELLETHVTIHDLRIHRLLDILPFLEKDIFASTPQPPPPLHTQPLERRYSI